MYTIYRILSPPNWKQLVGEHAGTHTNKNVHNKVANIIVKKVLFLQIRLIIILQTTILLHSK